mgnify:FL=1
MPREFALPGTKARYAPDRPFDVQHYKLDLELDIEAKSFSGTCTIRLAPVSPDQTYVELDAVELDILRVCEDGDERSFSHDGKTLRIHFAEAAVAGLPLEIAIEYAAVPRRGLYFVGPDEHYPNKPSQVWTQGQDEDSRYWFPCFDSPIFKATSEVIVRIPKLWYALSNGSLMADTTKGKTRQMHWRFDVPHSCYLMTLAAGEFACHSDSQGDVEITYFSEPARLGDCIRTLAKTPEMIATFSERFGVQYPYKKYAQVFVADFIFGGMENTTATSLTDGVLVDERASLDFDMESLVCHELAHQWFGDLLTCRDWGEGWLNEGFATYSEYLWREHSEGRDEASLVLVDFSDAYFAEDSSRYRRPIVTKRYDDPLDIFDRHLYDKAGRVVHMIRRILGDADFFASVQHYLEHHRGDVVETRDLARAIDRACGRNLDWFFDQWLLEGSGHPELLMKVRWHEKQHVLEVEIQQTHKVTKTTPLFRLPTELRLVCGGETRDMELDLREQSQVITIACESQPNQVILDPGKHLICRLRSEKAPSLWLSQLAHAGEAIDRIVAATICGQQGGHKMLQALTTSLASDPFWAVQAAAAKALGATRSPTVLPTLIATLRDAANPKVRRAAAAALGNFRGDADASKALVALIKAGDKSYFVEAEACASLGKIRSSQALVVLKGALKRESFMDIIQQKCCEGLGALDDDGALPILIAQSEIGKGGFARRAAMRALAVLGKNRDDKQGRVIRELLTERIRDPDFRVQMQAIASLEALGDVAACGVLSAVVEKGFDNRLKRRSREAIRTLREGKGQSREVATLRDASEQLRQQVAGLRNRISVMETARDQERQSRRVEKAPVPATPARRVPSSAPTPQRRRGGGKKPLR